MVRPVDLNSDLGEGFGPWRMGDDAGIMEQVTSVNIACGLHAGDPAIMAGTVTLALSRGVAIGAHPGYPDLAGFGRREIGCSPSEIRAFCLYQIGALSAIARAEGGRLQHVKAHGALYNRAAGDELVAGAIASAARDMEEDLILVGPPGSAFEKVCHAEGIPFAAEGFADRAYSRDGTLVPRSVPGSVIDDPAEAASRAVRMVSEGRVHDIGGGEIFLMPDTICLHGDTPGAVRMAKAIRSALKDAGVEILPMGDFRRR